MAPLRCLAVLSALAPASVGAFSCLSESGKFVDYYAALKGNAGTDMHYHDAHSSGSFKNGAALDSDGSAIIATVKQLYGSFGKSFAYAVYNDEKDDGTTSSTRAHSKGVILFDGSRGFWLVHSLPKWPGAVETGFSALPTTVFAQSYLCMSFRISALEDIAKIQLLQWPQVYSSGLSDDLAKKLPNFKAWIEGGKTRDATQLTTSLKTYSGRTFVSYGKSDQCNCDLYADVVAKELNGDLYVESWQNGAAKLKMPSFCKKDGHAHNVYNIQSLAFAGDRTWVEAQDHSKWAITSSHKKARAVCIGDINRQFSQEGRGGGTVCYEDADLWKAFNGIVATYEKCDSATSGNSHLADNVTSTMLV